MNPIGLFRKKEKEVILPPNIPDPPERFGLQFTRGFAKVAGGPVGGEQARGTFQEKKARWYQARTDKFLTLRTVDPQATMKLLWCANQGMDYHVGLTGNVLLPGGQRIDTFWDQHMHNAVDLTLLPTGYDDPGTSEARLNRAHFLASLPHN